MASRMRTTVTLGNWSVTVLKIASSASGVAFTVARKVCGALSSVPGEKTKTKLMASVCHSMRRSEAIVASMSRPSTFTVMVSPSFDAEGLGQRLVERDELRPVIVGRPPFAGDDARALGRRRRIGDAAVAVDRPARLGRHVRPRSTGLPPILTMRPRSDGTLSSAPAPGTAAMAFSKVGDLGRLDVDEEEGRRVARDALRDLLAQIALDQRRRHQHGEAEPQRQHDDRRRRAGPVQVGERQPQRGELRLAGARRRHHQKPRQQREGDEGADRAQHEPARDARLVGGEDGEARQHHGDGADQQRRRARQPPAVWRPRRRASGSRPARGAARISGIRANSSDTSRPKRAAMASGRT